MCKKCLIKALMNIRKWTAISDSVVWFLRTLLARVIDNTHVLYETDAHALCNKLGDDDVTHWCTYRGVSDGRSKGCATSSVRRSRRNGGGAGCSCCSSERVENAERCGHLLHSTQLPLAFWVGKLYDEARRGALQTIYHLYGSLVALLHTVTARKRVSRSRPPHASNVTPLIDIE